MKECPKCGYTENLSDKCVACGCDLKNVTTYEDKLSYWARHKANFLNVWNNKNNPNFYQYKNDLYKIEEAATEDDNLSCELAIFKAIMFGEFENTESCAAAYLSEPNEEAFKNFEVFIREETEKLMASPDNLKDNIFTYYNKIILFIETKIKRVSPDEESTERIKKLFEIIICNVNVLIKGMAKRTAAKGRFRLYKSETYPNIHDEYVEYLKTLKKAVESCNDEQIAHCLNEVY